MYVKFSLFPPLSLFPLPSLTPPIAAARPQPCLRAACFSHAFCKRDASPLPVRHDRVAALLVKNSPCAEEEWVDILSGLLTQNPGKGVEAIATVESEVAITITVRRRVKGITQRLGTLELKHNADEEIELFDWCGLAAAAVVQANVTLAAVTTKQTELEASVWQLKSQLDELVEAKRTDETELLLKFATCSTRKRHHSQARRAKTAGQGRTATRSRASKRKAAAPAAEDDDDGSDDGFEKMDVDTAVSKEADAEMSDQQRDTTDDETETASEHDEDEDDAEEEETKPAQQPARVQEDDAPPPARALPFMKKTAKKAAPAPPPTGSETESDDEL
ncbi:conserved hypothetical protein [Verticillium alfalfae VaMs.102]|uniref:Uncharacterized protein n=1 Tax=Verticillium alfalfae (strain VaMs.102 / ATCC MYA-4576 / FGSC 10136) TaxID=526221 RepID=C9SK86_VERA1|nr:conserved hypothetical protein [Verticillium alfalfae VaMs.102]EEY19104.1 conserved hypothetical protein [Verticillium alfalfae VaMs.102]